MNRRKGKLTQDDSKSPNGWSYSKRSTYNDFRPSELLGRWPANLLLQRRVGDDDHETMMPDAHKYFKELKG